MQSVTEELARSIKERRVILFVGAGVSMSVGLPSWQKLIDHMVRELGIEPEMIGSYQTLAEYYRLKQGSIGPLRSWLDRHWHVSSASDRRPQRVTGNTRAQTARRRQYPAFSEPPGHKPASP